MNETGYSIVNITPSISVSVSEKRWQLSGEVLIPINNIIPVNVYGQNVSTIRFNDNIANEITLLPQYVYKNKFDKVFLNLQGVIGHLTHLPTYVSPIKFAIIRNTDIALSTLKGYNDIFVIEKNTATSISSETEFYNPVPLGSEKVILTSRFDVPAGENLTVIIQKYLYSYDVSRYSYQDLFTKSYTQGDNQFFYETFQVDQGEIIAMIFRPSSTLTIDYYKFLFK